LLKAKEGEIAGKSVKSIDTRISDIKKDNKSLHKSIGKHKENIAEIKGEIAILNSSLKGNETEKVTLKSSENIDKKARKRLKALNKEGLKTIGEIEENKILVANEENNISNLETEIKTNNSNIELLQAELADHNEGALEEQLKLIEKEAKKLAQDQKGFQKSMKKANESINTNNEKIRVSEENIRSLKESQEKQKTNIKESLKKLNATKSTMKEYK
jgi:chromosome segregation ATPase